MNARVKPEHGDIGGIMQHKRRFSRAGILAMALLGLVVAVFTVLMTKEVTPPSQTIEKELDAKALLAK